MNNVNLIGRFTADPRISRTNTGLVIARWTLAVNRPPSKDGEKGADFISVVAFGKTAEIIEQYMKKGNEIAIEGRIQTGSYEKNGQTVYTTDVVANRVEFLRRPGESAGSGQPKSEPRQEEVPDWVKDSEPAPQNDQTSEQEDNNGDGGELPF